ncbi:MULTISPECIES: hypothetical protein [Chelativorans]|jgi:hypothetical protein|uniref:hypothetical protein n=1 Tax=Chelativorans TaxID=449972 RepID=UPI0005A2434F|nr:MULTISPECIES: hypothetical protein [Chelativorans]
MPKIGPATGLYPIAFQPADSVNTVRDVRNRGLTAQPQQQPQVQQNQPAATANAPTGNANGAGTSRS